MPQINLKNPVTLRIEEKGTGKDGKGVAFREIHLRAGLQDVSREIAEHEYIKACMRDKPKVNPSTTMTDREAAQGKFKSEEKSEEKNDPNAHPAERQSPKKSGDPAPIKD